jgi:hypothetical protein
MEDNKLLRLTASISSLFAIILVLFGGIKTPENFRTFEIIQNILIINLVIFVFYPDNRTFKIAFLIGIFTMLFDFVLETIAVILNWWYPLGGIQYPPIIIVPLEMLIGFLFIGTSIGIILTFPEKMREIDSKLLNWLKPLFKEQKYDKVWRVLFIFVNAIIGTHGDYTAGPTIWAPGPNWYPIYTFFVWFGGGIIILLVFNYLRMKIKEK